MRTSACCKLHTEDRGSIPGPAKVQFGQLTWSVIISLPLRGRGGGGELSGSLWDRRIQQHSGCLGITVRRGIKKARHSQDRQIHPGVEGQGVDGVSLANSKHGAIGIDRVHLPNKFGENGGKKIRIK